MKNRAVSLVVAAVLVAGSARGQQKPTQAPDSAEMDDARQHFQRGVELYREGSFDAALAEFTKAYDLAPNYRVLFNLAQVQSERHDYVAALTLFEKYLAEGGTEIPADRREQVTREISSLEGRVARITIAANVDGAELFIDGSSAGVLPLKDPVLVSAGVRQIQVRKAGYEAATKRETIAGGDSTHLDFELTAIDAARAVAAPAPQAPARTESDVLASPDVAQPPPDRTAFWVTLASTGLLAGAAVTFGVLTHDANDKLDQRLGAFPTDPHGIADARSTLKRDALLTDIFTGAAVASGAFCLYFGLSGSGGHSKAGEVARTGLYIAPAGTGVRALGRF